MQWIADQIICFIEWLDERNEKSRLRKEEREKDD